MMAAGCTSRDDGRVNMEILLSTVWCGERFTPDIQQNTVPERDAESALFLYICLLYTSPSPRDNV